MNILSGVSDFFGLDIGTTALRVVQLRGAGPVKSLDRYGQMPINGTAVLSDSKADRDNVSATIREFVKQVGITTRNVAVNVPSSKVFTTITDWNKMPGDELAKTIRYQADSIIPTPLNESKLDWVVVGQAPQDSNKVEVLLSSVPNDFVELRLDMLESAGLNVIAFEPDGFALSRALAQPNVAQPQLVLDTGNTSTDLIITMDGIPRLIRSIPVGTSTMVRAVAQNLNIDVNQAEQFVFKFGLSKDKLEGRIHGAVISTVEAMVGEIDKSIKFFQNRYTNSKIDRIIVTGGASVLPEFPLYLANKFGLNVEIGNAWRNVSFPPDRQNELMAVSSHFGVAAGLAERKE
ncbi:MAG: type IV pilus assembly protein PilM [Candidatus Saccharimonadales bacterium]